MSFLKLFKFSILLIVINLLLPIHKSPSNKIFANEPNIKNLEKYIRSIPENNFYILGPGDIINIKVSENTKDLNIPFKVNSEGIANLQRLKRIYVSGLTLDELTKILNKEYASYVQNPNVSLDVLVYRPVKIYVDGEVANPGLHVLPGSIRSDQDLNKFNFFKIADSDQLSNSRLLNRNNSLDISSKDFMPSEIFPLVQIANLLITELEPGDRVPEKLQEINIKILNINDQNPDGLFIAGLIEEKRGNFEKALTYWENLLKILPENDSAIQSIKKRILVLKKD